MIIFCKHCCYYNLEEVEFQKCSIICKLITKYTDFLHLHPYWRKLVGYLMVFCNVELLPKCHDSHYWPEYSLDSISSFGSNLLLVFEFSTKLFEPIKLNYS